MHTYMYKAIIYIYICIYIYIYVYVCLYIYKNMYVYIYIYMYVHILTHVLEPKRGSSSLTVGLMLFPYRHMDRWGISCWMCQGFWV